jgi:hypothetical protein
MSSLLNPTSQKKKIESNESTQNFTSTADVKFSFATTACVAPWNHPKRIVVLFHRAIQDHLNDPALVLASFIKGPGYTDFQWDSQVPHIAGKTTASLAVARQFSHVRTRKLYGSFWQLWQPLLFF